MLDAAKNPSHLQPQVSAMTLTESCRWSCVYTAHNTFGASSVAYQNAVADPSNDNYHYANFNFCFAKINN